MIVILVQVTKEYLVHVLLLKIHDVFRVLAANICQETRVTIAEVRAVIISTNQHTVVASQILRVLIFQVNIIKLALHLMQRAEEAVLHQISKLKVVGVGTIVFVNNVGGDHTRAVIHV